MSGESASVRNSPRARSKSSSAAASRPAATSSRPRLPRLLACSRESPRLLEDRQGLRIGPAGVLLPAELAVDHTESGQRDGPPAAPGRAQRQGSLERLQGRAGASRVQGEEPQSIQGGGLVGAILRLAEERERAAEPLAGPVRLSQIAVEMPPVEQECRPACQDHRPAARERARGRRGPPPRRSARACEARWPRLLEITASS